MKLRTKFAVGAGSALLVVSLVGLSSPVWMPLLPQQWQQTLGGQIQTRQGTVDELFRLTDTGPYRIPSADEPTHAEVDEEYRLAAAVWPWDLPPHWSFPNNRGVPDVPGHHWTGMGVKAAFALWAQRSLDAVRAGALEDADADHLLDEVEDAYRTLFAEGLLTDRRFVEASIDPLRR